MFGAMEKLCDPGNLAWCHQSHASNKFLEIHFFVIFCLSYVTVCLMSSLLHCLPCHIPIQQLLIAGMYCSLHVAGTSRDQYIMMHCIMAKQEITIIRVLEQQI